MAADRVTRAQPALRRSNHLLLRAHTPDPEAEPEPAGWGRATKSPVKGSDPSSFWGTAISHSDDALVPEIVRAWGPHVGGDRRCISLCMPEATSVRTRTNVGNGQVAVAFSNTANCVSA